MQFYIDITNSSGTRYGSGPIASASYWRSTKRVDRIGGFEFAMPASDEKALAIANRRYATCYAILDSGPTVVGSGVIDRIETRPDNDGNVELVVSGDDLLRELIWKSARFTKLYSAGLLPISHSDAAIRIYLNFPGGWTLTADTAPPNNSIYFSFSGETCYAAALRLGELTRSHLWMPTARNARYQSTWNSSGLRAIEAGSAPLATNDICFIGELQITEDTYDLISRVIPYGPLIPGSATDHTSLLDTTRVPPSGYTIDLTDLVRDATEATYGRVEEWISYNDIRAEDAAASTITSAANQLYDAAFWELQRRSDLASFYHMNLIYAPTVIEPMQTIRCIFRRAVDGRNVTDIDETLYIMGATTTVDVDGLRTTALDVATIDRWPQSDMDSMRKLTLDNQRSII